VGTKSTFYLFKAVGGHVEVEAEYFLKVKRLFSGAEYETINLGFWTA
jgi:hypothetical protein